MQTTKLAPSSATIDPLPPRGGLSHFASPRRSPAPAPAPVASLPLGFAEAVRQLEAVAEANGHVTTDEIEETASECGLDADEFDRVFSVLRERAVKIVDP